MALDIISTINLDLKRPNTETVYAVQYDTAGRIKAQLTNDGEAWHVPSSAGGMVSFRKSDNIGGFYDTTELGEVAVSVDENDDSIIYIALDAQTTITATSLDHPVQMQINFYNSQGKRLSTFAFYLRVQASVLFDGDQDERPVASEWTFRILTGALGQTIKNQEDAIKWMEDNIRTQAGYVVDDTLKVPGAAGDAKKIGELFEEIVKISDSMPGYFPTTDTARVGSTKYYTRSGTSPNYVYTEYTGATFATGVTYYEYSPWNRIWIDPDDNDVAIPTMDEIDELNRQLIDVDGYFVEGINLFNPNDPDIVENSEISTSGVISTKNGSFVSGYIPVIPGMSVCCHYQTGIYGASSRLILYNENKERVDYVNGASTGFQRLTDSNGNNYVKYSFLATTQAKYFRSIGSMASAYFYMYVYASEMPSTYVPYTDKVVLSDDVAVPFANVTDVEISKEDTDFVTIAPKNLVDKSTLVAGVIGNGTTTAGAAVDTSATNWVTSDYIPVKPNTLYSLMVEPGVYYGSGWRGIPYFDKDKNYMGRIIPAGGVRSMTALDTITTPSNNRIAYIRTSWLKSKLTHPKLWWTLMVIEGTWPGNMYITYDDDYRLRGAGLEIAYSEPLNCLFGKSALWNGDSICAADNDSENGGWPQRIATANGMRCKNYAIAGGTITENTTAAHSVSATLDTMISEFPDADYIIIEGGTNDADILGDSGIGTFDQNDFTAEYLAALDRNTFSGAVESVFYRLVTKMKGKHIGYLIPQKMGHTEVLVTRRRTYFDRAIAIAQKWGVPVLDLWNGLYFNWRLSAHWDQTMTSAENEEAGNLYMDGQHITTTGYAIQSPIIAEWMKTI